MADANVRHASGRLIRGVRGEMQLSRVAVSLGDNNVKIDIMAFGVPWDCSSRRFLQHANHKSQSTTSLSWAHWQRRELHCPALSNCCRFFQLAACGRRTSLCSSIAGLSRKEFPVMTDRRRHLFTRTGNSWSFFSVNSRNFSRMKPNSVQFGARPIRARSYYRRWQTMDLTENTCSKCKE